MEMSSNCTLIESDGVPHTVHLARDMAARQQSDGQSLLYFMSISNTRLPLGIEGRTMTQPLSVGNLFAGPVRKVTKYVDGADGKFKQRKKTRDGYLIAVDRHHDIQEMSVEKYADQINGWLPDSAFDAAWESNGFVLVAYTDQSIAFARALEIALLRGDVAAWVGTFNGSDPYPGLVLSIPSLVPESIKKMMRDEDQDAIDLAAAAQATGIAERLQAANDKSGAFYPLPYGAHALSPAWFEAGGMALETDYPVVFFLNPHNQADNNFGWFSVEQLDQWIAGVGPIPKTQQHEPSGAIGQV